MLIKNEKMKLKKFTIVAKGWGGGGEEEGGGRGEGEEGGGEEEVKHVNQE